jgi:biopolymer transport protein ExbD
MPSRSPFEPVSNDMKKSKHIIPEADQPALEVASLIDVCFLLLIYFIATSTIIPRESDLGMQIPSKGADSPDVALFEPLLIQISESGEIQAGDKIHSQAMDSDVSVRSLPLLQHYLEMFVSASNAANTRALVHIEADDNASHQRVIDVLNALAKTQIHAVTFSDLVP